MDYRIIEQANKTYRIEQKRFIPFLFATIRDGDGFIVHWPSEEEARKSVRDFVQERGKLKQDRKDLKAAKKADKKYRGRVIKL